MSGKRLLDAARFYGALKAVAGSHYAIRAQQLDTFSKTSTVAKAIKNQTDRVTVTLGAAYTLASRLNDTPDTYRPTTTQGQRESGTKQTKEEGVKQDHHYDRKESHGTVEDAAPETMEVGQKQSEEAPLPDGTIPTAGGSRVKAAATTPGSDVYSERPTRASAKEPLQDESHPEGLDVTQKAAERNALPDGTIPPEGTLQDEHAAGAGSEVFGARPETEAPKTPLQDQQKNATDLHPRESSASTIPDPSQAIKKAQRLSESQLPSSVASDASRGNVSDTFTLRSQETSSSLSSLPRSKIPKHIQSTEGSDQINAGSINSDVFYAPSPNTQRHEVSEEVPEGVDLNIFHSPSGAMLLNRGDKEDRRQAYKRRMDEARAAAAAAKSREASSPIMQSRQTETSEEQDSRDLAQTLAAEVQQQEARHTTEAVDQSEQFPRNEMHESRVPASRFGRIWQFGGLATSMAFGAVGETFKRVTGGSSDGSIMLSEANMNRLVAKLSRMRGAALKLGQMMSFQDSKMLPPAINAVLQRVQDSADYMPTWQRDQVLANNLGEKWRELFSSFEDVPIAAASIGQVHKATMASNGHSVAVKVQYPGVKNSIDSDLNNLSLLLTASRLLPKGLYLDKTIANARTELAWECDYVREAECGERFSELLASEKDTFTVPRVYSEACGPEVLTAEFMSGRGVTKIKDLTQDERDWIGTQILRLCLRELMEWRFMQTDPNWTNFLYDRKTKKLQLLDFGASREFPTAFVKPYVELLIAASKKDRALCKNKSIELGYLTGHESKIMLEAHVDSILTLAEPFMESTELANGGAYDFRDQTITDRVRAKIGIMVNERLAPPPEETYSLHRKLSGAFLLCARLGSRVKTRDMFADAVQKWRRENA